MSTIERPVFVIGAARSGTTLTGKIIGGLDNVHSPGESHFFEDIWSRRSELGPLNQPKEINQLKKRVSTLFGRYNFPETQKIVDSQININEAIEKALNTPGNKYAQIYLEFMGALSQDAGKSRFCDDTPKHLFYLEDILNLFPDAKIIYCLRDPRGFLASYKNYWRRSSESERVKALYHPIITSLLWRSTNRKMIHMLAELPENKVHILKYEKLVQNPYSEIQQICQFIEEPFSEEILQVDSNNSSYVSENDDARGIFKHSIGKWENDLDSFEIWWSQIINRSSMEYFQYEHVKTDVAPLKCLWQLINLPFVLLNALKANSKKRGPLLSYLFRRITPLIQRK